MIRQAAEQRDSTEIDRALDRVFARPEFGEEERTLFDEFLDWLSESLDLDVDPGTVGGALDGGMRIALVLLAVGLLWLIVRAARGYVLQRMSQHSDRVAERLAVHKRVRELYAGALRAREAGDFRLAVRLGLFALVTGLGMNGALEYRDAWTYREILRNGAPDESISELLGGLVEELEAKEFGDARVALEDLDRLEELCQAHLSEVLELSA